MLSDNDSEDDFGKEEVLLIDRNNTAVDNVQIIAPGQNQKPVAWNLIENFDELCFSKIFAGHAFTLPYFVSYTDRAKSECRRADRRSCIPSRVLFMAKQKVEKQCLANINVYMRKTKKSSNINAGNLVKQNFVNNLIRIDSGYQFIKEIRSSPAYWERKKKELLAMIRQLGKPTLFLTLSVTESRWPELKAYLARINLNRKLTTEEALELNDYEKTNLIRNDPVTCAQYFDYKISNIMKL